MALHIFLNTVISVNRGDILTLNFVAGLIKLPGNKADMPKMCRCGIFSLFQTWCTSSVSQHTGGTKAKAYLYCRHFR